MLTRTPPQADAPDVGDVMCGPVDVVLEVELALSPLDTRKSTYAQSKRVYQRGMRGEAVVALLDGAVANAELRMNFPQLREPWTLYTYTVAEAKDGEAFKLPQNWVGKLWDPMLKDGQGLLSYLGLEALVVACIDNYEVRALRARAARLAGKRMSSPPGRRPAPPHLLADAPPRALSVAPPARRSSSRPTTSAASPTSTPTTTAAGPSSRC